ncbi:MAG: hypothetical protein ACPGYV_05545 [Phycisphaeraceae bacterium]
MSDALAPYVELLKDAGLALTDAGYAYGLFVAAAPVLTLAGLLVLVGLIATHGKSHGTRFSAMALFVFAALAGGCAWLLRPDAAAGTILGSLLTWAWLAPLVAAITLFATMLEKPKPRALGLGVSLAAALIATCFGGMLSIANERTLHPDDMARLDAEPMPTHQEVENVYVEPRAILDTASER